MTEPKKKRGRPPVFDPATNRTWTRLDDKELAELDKFCARYRWPRSQALRWIVRAFLMGDPLPGDDES